MAKHKSYDDEYRAGAVALLEGAGYPNTLGALERVATHLGVPTNTLRRWFHGTSNPPPNRVVRRKKLDLTKAIKQELAGLFPEMEDKRENASYKDLATAAGILIDKLQLLEGKPTEIVDDAAITDTERARRLTTILDRARARRDGLADWGNEEAPNAIVH